MQPLHPARTLLGRERDYAADTKARSERDGGSNGGRWPDQLRGNGRADEGMDGVTDDGQQHRQNAERATQRHGFRDLIFGLPSYGPHVDVVGRLKRIVMLAVLVNSISDYLQGPLQPQPQLECDHDDDHDSRNLG